jgi:hypothetical protein
VPDIVTTQTFSDGEKGITATKMNNIIANSVIQPDFVTAKPSSSTLDPTDQLLEVKGAGTYARITGQQLIDSVSASVTQNITPTIWSVRLRSLNAAGNPTFECDQVNIGGTVVVANAKTIDRWFSSKGGTMVASAAQTSAAAGDVLVPGTNFCITRSFLRITLTTQQATLGASDGLTVYQLIEGPRFRELQYDVHSSQILVRSSVSGLKFGLCLKDASTRSLTKLCTIPSANTWTLIQLPNLPVWPSAGAFSSAPGVNGYQLVIALAAGTSATSPANDTWQNGNFYGALGQSNFAASPVNSTFDIAFIQHEPGALCSTPMDCPFGTNYDGDFGCLRYFYKTYELTGALGNTSGVGAKSFQTAAASTAAFGPIQLPKPMAKVPAYTFYNHATGAANSVQDGLGTNHAGATAQVPSSNGFLYLSFTTATTSAVQVYTQFTADTGW